MATIKDVAREAGVSTATVSYVINKTRRVNRETAQKVVQAIKLLKYQPSRIAQSLVTKSTKIISVLISDITDSFFAPIVRGVEDVASRADYIVMVCNCDEDCAKTLKYLNALVRHRVDGLIISPTEGLERHLSVFEEMNIPIVFVNRRLEDYATDVVENDNQYGAHLAIKHLTDLGHRKIGLISGPATVSTYHERIQGYLQALEEAGIPVNPSYMKTGGFHPDTGYRIAKELWEMPDRPTAFFIASGRLTIGAFQALRELNVAIPEQLSVLPFDQTDWSALVNPSLTLVNQKTYEMGSKAAEILLERIEKQNEAALDSEDAVSEISPPRSIRIKPELVIRNSTVSLRK